MTEGGETFQEQLENLSPLDVVLNNFGEEGVVMRVTNDRPWNNRVFVKYVSDQVFHKAGEIEDHKPSQLTKIQHRKLAII